MLENPKKICYNYSMGNLENLRAECLECRRCVLCEHRTNLVFGSGNPSAELMLVGEGPGEQEDLRGEPFVGRAGKLLDTMLAIIELDRSEVYIANAVKCRPPGNRDPLTDEMDACSEWLRRQIEIVNPRLIVCLGRISAGRLINPNFKITREHGKWFRTQDGRDISAVYHPAALLRDPSKRPETFVDLKNIERKLKAF